MPTRVGSPNKTNKHHDLGPPVGGTILTIPTEFNDPDPLNVVSTHPDQSRPELFNPDQVNVVSTHPRSRPIPTRLLHNPDQVNLVSYPTRPISTRFDQSRPNHNKIPTKSRRRGPTYGRALDVTVYLLCFIDLLSKTNTIQ